jgi:class 3 adenylate cyclase
MERPETLFVWNGPNALAYQVIGDGPRDLLYLPGWISNVELNWAHPSMRRFLRGLARGRRLIATDPRGVGCSERATPHDIWPLETIMEDVAVVLDACSSERAAILATQQCGFVACMFAATYPERTDAVILYEAGANFTWTEATPWEWTDEQHEEDIAAIRAGWGTREYIVDDILWRDPSMADNTAYLDWWQTYHTLSLAPGAAIGAVSMYTMTDIRPLLPSIQAPVLVLSRPGHVEQSFVHAARFLAERIPGARLVELDGADLSLWMGDQAAVHRAIDGFLADVDREQSELARVVATVLFTDIVGSTTKAAELGDRGWGELVERHHAAVRALLARFRGTEVDTAGDGFYATFDGPARAIRCAQAIVEEVRSLGVEVRAGLHTGECEIIAGKLGGMAVNIGARVGAAAAPSEVLVSQTVKDLVVGSGLEFEDRGEHELKGVADRWRLFRVG